MHWKKSSSMNSLKHWCNLEMWLMWPKCFAVCIIVPGEVPWEFKGWCHNPQIVLYWDSIHFLVFCNTSHVAPSLNPGWWISQKAMMTSHYFVLHGCYIEMSGIYIRHWMSDMMSDIHIGCLIYILNVQYTYWVSDTCRMSDVYIGYLISLKWQQKWQWVTKLHVCLKLVQKPT